ncbi:carboxylating nicotinate-nucleotide diphosphorylase [Amphiplicatus metriothermophilus]|uniref:Probable nicotinate-nucleotide pyrophosphorylase [carboxylating] n=1 Tax=Amphiplicatus metriothermophilus TaxID=1519374 RepID=A0A239PZF0_9PROT|nr:carboxylating nicotinate-nucleotide diphosphorylase [Amphiplicatus metriothermophilus]MBB5518296.1 nicotinate-nucleotide pyrophosphorylase (carboxylating) [Amphiplicatus metriothermophilus]SNT75550.1 nicotinate-nucleotide pyrophosphorylase [carboxylating] [Amphiplicatus metriothermophilus]
MTTPLLPDFIVEEIVARALKEDLGEAGDITTNACIPARAQARAVIAARKAGVIAGVETARAVFRLIDPTLHVKVERGDGASAAPGETVFAVEGAARAILTAERVALNFLGHLSGVASATAALVAAVTGTKARIVCTRKTTPGLRALEKYAVRCGGGLNHRFGLYDAMMIKDNHIAAAGGVAQALRAARAAAGHMVRIEIEIDRLSQLETALAEGADAILLDNMSVDDMKRAVHMTRGRAALEASGNVTPDTARAVAETGVDYISSGWITHSAPALDLGLDFV